MRNLDHMEDILCFFHVPLLHHPNLLLVTNKKLIQEKEKPSKIQIRIIKKYFMSLNTAMSISIIKANPENALRYVAILIQLKIIANAPNILIVNSLLN